MKTKLYQIIAALLFIATTCAAQEQPATRTEKISGVRPVADSVLAIERAYLVPINYEDIRYVTPEIGLTSRTLMQDWTATLRSDVTFQSPFADRKKAARDALTDLLAHYERATGYSNVFAVLDNGDSLALVPTHSPNGGGGMETITPILATRITLPAENRSAAALITAIGEQVSQATGKPLVAGTPPQPLFDGDQTSIGASNEPARSVLARLLKEVPVGYMSEPNLAGGVHPVPTTFASQVLCEHDDMCAINVHVIQPQGRGAIGMEPPTQSGLLNMPPE